MHIYGRIALIITILFIFQFTLKAQEEGKKTKFGKNIDFSGYIQSQYQYFFIEDSIGSVPKNFAHFYGGNFINRITNERFSIRRGRLKFSHNTDNTKAVLSFDISERGFSVKDLFLSFTENKLNAISISAGIFKRPFGYEIAQSSSDRWSPERARINQTLFPGERDLGAKLCFQMPEESFLSPLKIEFAVVNGQASAIEMDNYKDMLGHISYSTFDNRKKQDFSFGLGLSIYKGYVNHIYEPTDTSNAAYKKYYIYDMGTVTNDSTGESYTGFVVDSVRSKEAGMYGKKIDRIYYGFDAQLSFKSPFGRMQILGEYIMGKQPGFIYTNQLDKPSHIYNDMTTMSPHGPALGFGLPSGKQAVHYDPVKLKNIDIPHNTMLREFNGGYICFIQDIKKSGHQIMIKYDWYDPNTDVSGDEITTDWLINDNDFLDTLPNTYLSPADVMYSTIGIGWIWKINDHVKLTLYYENVQNEITGIKPDEGDLNNGWFPSPGYNTDIKDDVFTFRFQYKF